MNECAWARCAAWRTSSSLASGRPKRMFSAIVVEKSSGSCVTTPICDRRLANSRSRTS